MQSFKLTNMTEKWKNINGFDGFYQISDQGNIKSFKGQTPKNLKAGTDKDGYKYVLLSGSSVKNVTVHKLVALHFCDGHQEGLQVNHINGNRSDNRSVNLEWVTHRQNQERYRSNRAKYGCGISRTKSGRYRLNILVKGKNKYLGTYDTAQQARAVKAYFKKQNNIK